MAEGYRGAAWPLPEHWVTAYGGAIEGAHRGYNAVQGELRAEYDRRVAEVKADADLTHAGKSKRLAALAEQYRAHPVVKKFQADLGALRKQEETVRTRLTTRPRPKPSENADEAVRAAFAEHRAILRFEALTPTDRREAVRLALEKGDHRFLGILLSEPALLNAEIAKRVEVELARSGDPDAFRELEHLVGKTQFNGDADPLAGVLPVAGQALSLFLEHVDQTAGIDTAEREAEAVVDAADKNGVITLTPEQGHDPRVYRAAYARAAAKGGDLRIAGDEGEGSIAPGEFAPVNAQGK